MVRPCGLTVKIPNSASLWSAFREMLVPNLRILVVVGAAAFGATLTVGAHDFWLMPDAFSVSPEQHISVRGQTSSAFPTSESAVTVDRVTSARVLGANDEETITALSTSEQSLLLRHRPKTPGQKLVAVTLGWRHVKETADSFRKYLVAEGAEEALKRHEAAGTLPTVPIIRRYAKYGKTVVEVGTGARAYQRVVGHPLEFVPLTDPNEARAGAEFRVRLLFNGSRLPRARFHAGLAPAKGDARRKDLDLTTDDDGTAVVPLTASGLWNVRTIHVVPAPSGTDADWEVHWATFVFQAR